VFTEDYHRHFAFKDGYIQNGERLHKPLSFDLDPGDAVLFLSRHLHGSELNRTDQTRYVVSYRVTFGKPHYPHGHYHQYLHSGLAGGPLRRFAHVPQNLQPSFVRYQFRRVQNLLSGRRRMSGVDGVAARTNAPARRDPPQSSVSLADFPVGTIEAVASNACVARLGEDEFAAFGRFCPHSGGDLSGGWVDGDKVVCPLHSLTIDCRTGRSPCASLKPLRQFPCQVRDGRVYVSVAASAGADGEVIRDYAATT
jgi:nitrite reductase/ring-hydroxylating ferredoxin subunit